jgi:sugar/nucleoside kinase (ribokinase family)
MDKFNPHIGEHMTSDPTFDIAFIGNYTKDTIITPAGTRYVDGGAVNYAAHAAVRLGKRTAVITHLAQEDKRMIDSLTASGVVCFPAYTQHSTNITLEYPGVNPDIRNLYVTHVADPLHPDELDAFSAAWIVIGSTLRGEVDLGVISRAKASGAMIGLDVQGFVRVLRGQELRNEPWEEMRSILALVDVLKSDAMEAEFLTGKTDIYEAAKFYADLGPSEIVLTHKDGLLIYASGKFHICRFHPESLLGRSGRGDTCLGSYIASRMDKDPELSATYAAAVTSLKMEKPCPYDRTEAVLNAFIQKWYSN